MRRNLVGAFLLLIVGVALSASVIFNGPPSRKVASDPAISRSFSKIVELPLAPGRERISLAEASAANARKLLPSGARSLLEVPAPLRHGDYMWKEDGVPAGKLAIWVDLRRQMISVFRDGHEIGTAVIVYGAEGKPSPEGVFPITKKSSEYHSRTYDTPMPYSMFFAGDGVALHGSPMSSRRASHGCIGLPVDFAEKLFKAAQVGDIVSVTRSYSTPEK